MEAPVTVILAMLLMACAFLGQMRMLRHREEVQLDRLEAYLRTLGNEPYVLTLDEPPALRYPGKKEE